MRSYCQICKRAQEVKDLQTVKLPNLSYVHKGRCEVCEGEVWVKVFPRDVLVPRSGYHVPREVYVGANTSLRLVDDRQGQVLIYKTGQRDPTKTKDEVSKIQTLETLETKRRVQ